MSAVRVAAAVAVILALIATPSEGLDPATFAELGGALLQAGLLLPEYPKPGTVREAVYVLSVPGDRATLDLVFDVPPWARVLDLYLSAGSRVLGAGMVPRSAYSGLDHYVPAPELPGFVRLELAGERTERWSSDRFPATDPWLRGLLKRHGLRWTVVRYFLPRNGLFWARCEVPLLDGFVVWPAPFVGGYYVYGGVTEARLVPEGGPDRRLTFGPLPPLSDLDATLVLVLDGPPAVVVSSRGFHRTVLVFRPVGASPEAYRYAADPLRVALGLLGGAVSLLVRPTVPKALAALLVLVPVAGLDYRWPWLTGWATLGPAVLFLCLLHVL